MNIEYRPLQPEESQMYRRIRLESLQKFPESFGITYEEAIKNEKLRIEYDIENQSADRFVVGAFAEDRLIGICTFVKNEDGHGNIYQLYVKETFQGNNAGARLIGKLIDEASTRFGDMEICLEVKKTNLKAYGLYKKLGFVEINGDLQNENDPALVMRYEPR